MKPVVLVAAIFLATTATFAQKNDNAFVPDKEREQAIMKILKRGYDAWFSGNTSVYPQAYADRIAYFDPGTGGKSIQTQQQLSEHVKNVESKGTYTEPTNVTFQHYADITILTFNFSQKANGTTVGWNVTEVYHKIGDEWKVVHGHYSFVGGQ